MEADLFKTDVKKLFSNICNEEKLQRKKRRWLMGFQVLESSLCPMKHIPKFLKDESLHESFLRDDDVSIETVRTCVERSFEALIGEQEGNYALQDYGKLFDIHMANCNTAQRSNLLSAINSALDDLNNSGLFRLAAILAGETIKFEKTRPRMKEFIQKHLPTRITKKSHEHWKNELIQLFMDPSNVRKNQFSIQNPVPQSLVSAATKILERLDDIDKSALEAMYRKLRGTVIVPQIKFRPPTLTGKLLIEQVRDSCDKMISRLSEGDELPKPLAEAMAVAGLWLKQQRQLVYFSIPDFYQFPPEIKALQNQILKAIESLGKVRIEKLRNLEPILDPKAEVSRRAFRSSTRRLLTEYLYECGNVDIPKSLLRAISFINKNCGGQVSTSSRETMEEDLECVLDVSSRLRQIIWEMLPDQNIDQEFADAYMDDLDSGDDGEDKDIELDNDRNCSNFEYFSMPSPRDACFGQSAQQKSHASHSDDESVGDSRPFSSPVSATYGSGSPQLGEARTNFNGTLTEEPKFEESASPHSSDRHGIVSESCLEDLVSYQSFPQEASNKCENQYLAMQDICDETSLVAYRLIGRLLEEFLQIQGVHLDTNMILYLRGGASIPADFQGTGEMQTDTTEDIGGSMILRAVKELVPSFPQSGIEKVKEMMGLL